MAKVGKITVSLTFDDIVDQHRFRIRRSVSKLQKMKGLARCSIAGWAFLKGFNLETS